MTVLASLSASALAAAPAAAASRALLAFLLLLGAIWLLMWYLQYQARRISEAWEALAAELEFAYKPARGPVFRRKSEEIEGIVDDVPVRLTRYGLSPGLDAAIYTRWSAELDPPPDLVLYVHRRHGLSRLAEKLGYEDVPLGDAEFDARFSTKCDEPGRVREVLTPEVRQKIAALRSAVVLVNETGVNVVWSGQIVAADELKTGLEVVSALLKTVPRAEPKKGGQGPAGKQNGRPDKDSEPDIV
jgi:hypothetical protein